MSNSSEEQGSPPPKKPGSSRPSLLGPATEHSNDDAVSILGAVKPESKDKRAAAAAPRVPSDRALSRNLLLLGGLATVAVALFFVLRQEDPTAPRQPVVVAAAAPAVPVPTPAAGTESPPASEPEPAQTATIETVPASGDAASVSADTAETGKTADNKKSSSAAAELASQSKPVVLSSSTSLSPSSAKKKDAPDAAPKPASVPVTKGADQVAREKARKSDDRLLSALNQSSDGSKPAQQRDIDLIAALLEHAAQPGTGSSSGTVKPGTKALPAGPKVALNNTVSRDVAERKPGVSTADLIRKCEDFGALEGLLCRIRICADLWGKDPACPAQNAPANVHP